MAKVTRIDNVNTVNFSDLYIGDYFFFYLHRRNDNIPLYLVISRDEAAVRFINVETNRIERMPLEDPAELVKLHRDAVSITWLNPLMKG